MKKEEPKKETLEEVAKKKSEYLADWEDKDMYKKGFIDGAKWQQQQNKNLYSEEKVSKAYDYAYHKGYNVGQKDAELHPLALTIADNIHKDKKEFIEQFKKK